MHDYKDPHSGAPAPLISDELLDIITTNTEKLNAAIV